MTEERRRHARVVVERACTLVGPAGSVEGTLRDVSIVGAKVVTDARPAADGERVELRCDGLAVSARVMYARSREGKILSGIQFLDLDADRLRAVTAFLESMLAGGVLRPKAEAGTPHTVGSGGGKREHPRVQLRARVVCKTPKRAAGVLHDISRGGVRVVLEEPVKPGDDITVEVMVGKLERPLVLTGSVVRVRSDESKERHLAGVKLAELSPDDARLLSQLLDAMTTVS